MLNFGQRKINKIGGSYMISLPIDWVKTQGIEVKLVNIQLNSDNTLKIAAGTPLQESTCCRA